MKKKLAPRNPWMFPALVGLCFVTVLVLWLPSFLNNIVAFGGGITQSIGGSKDALQILKDQFAAAKEKFTQINPVTSSTPARQLADEWQKNFEQVQGLPKSPDRITTQPIDASVKDPAKAYCTKHNGYYQARTVSSRAYGVCIFSNGTECEAQLFSRGQCHEGQYSVAEDGIPKKPDLFLTSDPAYLCTGSVRSACVEGLHVENIGWKKSLATTITAGSAIYTVPSLEIGASYRIPNPITVLPLQDGTYPDIVVDQARLIDEINEDNNTIVLTVPDAP